MWELQTVYVEWDQVTRRLGHNIATVWCTAAACVESGASAHILDRKVWYSRMLIIF